MVPSDSEEHEGMLIYIVNIATCMLVCVTLYCSVSYFSIFHYYYYYIIINICLQETKHKLETGENVYDKVVLSDSEEHEGMLVYIVIYSYMHVWYV